MFQHHASGRCTYLFFFTEVSDKFINDALIFVCMSVASACGSKNYFNRCCFLLQSKYTVIRVREARLGRFSFFAFALFNLCGVKLIMNGRCVCYTIDRLRARGPVFVYHDDMLLNAYEAPRSHRILS